MPSDEELASKSNSISERIGNAEPLTATSSAQQVEDISLLVRQYQNEYAPYGRDIERHYQNELEKYFDNLIEQLKQDEEIANSFGIEHIRRRQRELIRRIKGSITDQIAIHLSTDDRECTRILSMSKGYNRTNRMKEYVQRVIHNAKEDLIEVVSDSLHNQTDDIIEFLQERLDTQEREVNNVTRSFDQWMNDMEKNTFNQEQAQLEPKVKIYAIEQLDKIIKAA